MMDQKALFKQMISFQKTAFDNSMNAMTTLQEQNEKLLSTFLGQAVWLPEEGKKAVTNWMDAYQEGREKFKAAVEENFQKVEDYFGDSEETD